LKRSMLSSGLLVALLALAACAPAAAPIMPPEAMMESTPDAMMPGTPEAMLEKTSEPMMESTPAAMIMKPAEPLRDMPAWLSTSLTTGLCPFF